MSAIRAINVPVRYGPSVLARGSALLPIASTALRSLVLIAVAVLLILILLPAALGAAGIQAAGAS